MTLVNRNIEVSGVYFYNSDLYIALCANTQSQILPCHHIRPPLYPYTPFPLANSTLLFVSRSVLWSSNGSLSLVLRRPLFTFYLLETTLQLFYQIHHSTSFNFVTPSNFIFFLSIITLNYCIHLFIYLLVYLISPCT